MSTSCAAPSFLFPYHCSMAALSGRQPFHCSRAPFTYRCSCGCRLRSARPTLWWGRAPNHCDTWHRGALSRLCLLLSVSFLPGQSLLQSLLQTAAILLLLVLQVCLPLLHSNQIVEPSLKCLPASLSCHSCFAQCSPAPS